MTITKPANNPVSPDDFGKISYALSENLLLVSRQAKVLRANPAAARLLGKTLPQINGVALDDLFDPMPLQWAAYLTLCARSTSPVPGRFSLRTPDGAAASTYTITGNLIERGTDAATTLIMLRIQVQREALRAFSVLNEKIAQLEKEIAERRRAQEELSRHREHLEERVAERTAQLAVTFQELESFSYSVSHDLRAPLRAMHGFSAVLAEDCAEQLDDQCRSYIGRIQASSEKMGHLIDDLLQLSRISRVELNTLPVDICALVRQVLEGLRQRDPERRIELAVAPTCTVRGDERLLTIALENLIDNAWKFTRHQVQARIEFGQAEKNNETVHFVRDNGSGFDMTYVDKLFKPFQRLHTEQQFEGTGIGLSIAYRVIHRHGGRIWVEAEEGKGATFYFTLATLARQGHDDGKAT